MCGIGGILRIHAPGSPEAERLLAHMTEAAGGTPKEPGGMPTRYSARACDRAQTSIYELFHQPCKDGQPTADPVNAAPNPYGSAPWTIEEPWLDILEDSVAHRGPDGRGRFRDAALRPDGSVVEVALVHRRLSIIDHEGGAQPMVSAPGWHGHVPMPVASRGSRSADAAQPLAGNPTAPGATARRGTPRRSSASAQQTPDHPQTPIAAELDSPRNNLIAVAFNGCIYNHRELRQELEAKGHVFQTDHSDTEVLIHGWREWGASAVWKLRGMYGCAVWDAAAAQVFVSRDYFGERPLYLLNARTAPLQAFSGSPGGLHRLARQLETSEGREIEEAWLLPWIGKGYDNLATPWTGIVQVRQALTLTMLAETPGPHRAPTQSRPANPWSSTEVVIEPQGALVDRLDRMIQSVVAQTLEADVPIACLLSGGIDSSVIANAACRHVDRLQTITVRMPDPRYDESQEAEHVAGLIGSEHHTIDAPADPASDLVSLIESLGLPFGDSSLLPTYWACRAAAAHAKVLLTGDGGDEIFGGYERYQVAGLLRWGWWIPTFLGLHRLAGPNPKSRRSKLSRLATAGAFYGYVELLSIFPTPDRRRLFRSLAGVMPMAGSRCCSFEEARQFDLDEHLPGDMLRKLDHAAMCAHVEARAPFLDREFGEAIVHGLSKDVLLPDNQRKGLLRAVARKYFPPDIVDRPKMGFAIPIGEWFRSDYGGMRQLLHDHLNSAEPWGPSSLGIEAMINMDFVRQMLREHDQAGERSLFPWRGRDHSQRLYMLLVLSIWAKWLGRQTRAPSTPAAPSTPSTP